MKPAILTSLVAGLACTAIGLATGFFVGRQLGHDHDHDEEPAGAAPSEAHDHDHDLSSTTLANLGVTLAPARREDFTVTSSVTAVIENAPTTVQPIVAPVGGRIVELLAQPGDVVEPGGGIVRLLREPLPRPQLTLTGPLLSPASESLHDAVHMLRQARAEVELVTRELERVEQFTEPKGDGALPVLPRQRAIDLRQDLARAKAAWAHRVAELDKHGLTEAQIEDIARGAALPAFDDAMWRQALRHNGLWTGAAQVVHEALPEDVQSIPWVIATIGELAANGLVGPELGAWLAETPEAGRRFLAVGALLQQGFTLPAIRRLHELGALDPEVVLPAPRQVAPDWDVADVLVKPGVEIEAGQAVAILRDPRVLRLRATPLGSEVALLARAVAEGVPCRAEPLIEGTGPVLEGLRVQRLVEDEGRGDGVAYAPVANEPLASAPGGPRSWQLRPGMRYVLRVPERVLSGVFVLPAAALVEEGPAHVVFIRDEHGLEPVEVRVLHRDDRFAAVDVPADSHLAEGVEVVRTGAFALSLALQAEAGGAAHPHHH